MENKSGQNGTSDNLNPENNNPISTPINPTTSPAEQSIPTNTTENPVPVQVNENRSKRKTIFFSFLLFILLSSSLLFSFYNGLFNNLFQRIGLIQPALQAEQNMAADHPSGSVEIPLKELTIADLRLKVTTNSDPEQAKLAKGILEEMQVKEVVFESGVEAASLPVNKPQRTAGKEAKALIGYDPNLSNELVTEIRNALAKEFEEVEVREATDTGEFDLLIQTGEN